MPGRSATLVRNPNWNRATDTRPAYLDQINVNIGGDPNVIGRQVLDGSHAVQNDQLAAPIVKLAYQHYYTQLIAVLGAGLYYVAVDNSKGPFSNGNVRKALWAALDRDAMQKANGGALTAHLGTHFIYPATDGYQLAGGDGGPAVNYNMHPAGNPALAAKYMKAAGYPSGRYTGTATVQVVGSSGDPYADPAQIVNQTLQTLGFKTKFTLVDQSVMFTKFCGTPAQQIDVCPSTGWTRDFADPQTILDPNFAGYNITPTDNPNFGQGNDPRINTAMKSAEKIIGADARARAWAQIDRMLVNIAAAVPWAFLKNPTIESHKRTRDQQPVKRRVLGLLLHLPAVSRPQH